MRSIAQPIEKAESFDWESANPGPPPADADAPIEFNGEHFAREMFSPRGAIQSAILAAIRAAKSSIEIAMFTFACQEIADALLEMKEKGVNVRIVLDASQTRTGKFDQWFAARGFDVKVLAGPDPHGPWMFEKNHNKFMIVDGKLVETGSYNYTNNAEDHNFENVNFIADAARVAFFSAFFQMLHDLGWKPRAPKGQPDAGSPSDSDSDPGY
jgi:phosphatidylserine/phosphatidylglycerophosphate/cardiolipin synthase-like enzyme